MSGACRRYHTRVVWVHGREMVHTGKVGGGVSCAGGLTRLLNAVRKARGATPHTTERSSSEASRSTKDTPSEVRASAPTPHVMEVARDQLRQDAGKAASDARVYPDTCEGKHGSRASIRRKRKRRRKRKPLGPNPNCDAALDDGDDESPKLEGRARLTESGAGSAIHTAMDMVESCPEAAVCDAPELTHSSLVVPALAAHADGGSRAKESQGPEAGDTRRWDVNWLFCGDGRTRNGAAFKRGVVYFSHYVNVRTWGDFAPIFWDNGIFVDLPADGTCFYAQYRGTHMSLLDRKQCIVPAVPKSPGKALDQLDVRRHYEEQLCDWMSNHPGWMLKMYCNGARTLEVGHRKAQVEDWKTMTATHKLGCALSCVIDALHLLRGKDIASKAVQYARCLDTRSEGFESSSRHWIWFEGNL